MGEFIQSTMGKYGNKKWWKQQTESRPVTVRQTKSAHKVLYAFSLNFTTDSVQNSADEKMAVIFLIFPKNGT